MATLSQPAAVAAVAAAAAAASAAPASRLAEEIVVDKFTLPDGQVACHQYSKGKLLGKVRVCARARAELLRASAGTLRADRWLLRTLQGGFAHCYYFVNLQTEKSCAGKVVAKSSLVKSRAKAKVRRRWSAWCGLPV